MISRKSWGLVWEGSSFATIISWAPSTSFTESSSSAFPWLGALLSTFPVVGLGDWAVLVVGSGSSVWSPVVFPEGSSVVVVFSITWDLGVSETNSWWSSWDINKLSIIVVLSWNTSDYGNKCNEFHILIIFYKKLRLFIILLKNTFINSKKITEYYFNL